MLLESFVPLYHKKSGLSCVMNTKREDRNCGSNQKIERYSGKRGGELAVLYKGRGCLPVSDRVDFPTFGREFEANHMEGIKNRKNFCTIRT